MNKLIFFTLMLAILIIQGCSNARPALPELSKIDNQESLKKAWRKKVDGNFGETSERFNLIAEQDSLFLVTDKGSVYELDQENGAKKAYIETDYHPSAGVTRNGNVIYFGTYDAKLVAVSLDNQSVLWEAQLTSEVLAEASYAAGRLAVQTSDGWLTLLDANTGSIMWRIKEDLPDLTVRGTNAPKIIEGKVIAGFASGKLKAFSLQTGRLSWSYDIATPEGRYEIERLSDVDSRIAIKDGVVYSIAYNGNLVALSIETGRTLWQRSIASSVGLAIKGDFLAVVDMDSQVILLNAKNGSDVWQSEELVGRDLISPEFYREYLAVMDREGYVHLLNLQTGQIAAYTLADNDKPSGSRMVAYGEKLFVLTPDSNVTALTY